MYSRNHNVFLPNQLLQLGFTNIFQRILLTVLMITLFQGMSASVEAKPAPVPKATAEAVILVDMNTGGIIYEHNSDQRKNPASTTKIMTAILTLEEGDKDTEVTVSHHAADVESTWLEAGEKMRQFDMLELMLMESDNGAATALGESVAGSEKAFLKKMNMKAQEIGAKNTHYNNCHGLTDPQHYTTARDMAKIATYAMSKPMFRRIVATSSLRVPYIYPENHGIDCNNTNKLLRTYPGAIGVKTGWTRAAAGCLVAAAERDGQELLCVVLHSANAQSRFDEAAAFLDYGFNLLQRNQLWAV